MSEAVGLLSLREMSLAVEAIFDRSFMITLLPVIDALTASTSGQEWRAPSCRHHSSDISYAG